MQAKTTRKDIDLILPVLNGATASINKKMSDIADKAAIRRLVLQLF
ncbi:MAG: hypothetical protein U1F16_02160 [Turneriella sp.]